jgi:hypothetical protein
VRRRAPCAQVERRQTVGSASRRGRQRGRQVRRKQSRLGQQFFPARRAQVVEQRQQDDRNVLVPALQTLQVIRQLHDAAHQHRIGIVLGLDRAIEQSLRDMFHLVDHHRRAVQLDHAQRALHLVQIVRAEAHLAGVGRILDVGLERLMGFAQGLVEFLLDPVQGGEVDIVLQFHEMFPLYRLGPGCR